MKKASMIYQRPRPGDPSGSPGRGKHPSKKMWGNRRGTDDVHNLESGMYSRKIDIEQLLSSSFQNPRYPERSPARIQSTKANTGLKSFGFKDSRSGTPSNVKGDHRMFSPEDGYYSGEITDSFFNNHTAGLGHTTGLPSHIRKSSKGRDPAGNGMDTVTEVNRNNLKYTRANKSIQRKSTRSGTTHTTNIRQNMSRSDSRRKDYLDNFSRQGIGAESGKASPMVKRHDSSESRTSMSQEAPLHESRDLSLNSQMKRKSSKQLNAADVGNSGYSNQPRQRQVNLKQKPKGLKLNSSQLSFDSNSGGDIIMDIKSGKNAKQQSSTETRVPTRKSPSNAKNRPSSASKSRQGRGIKLESLKDSVKSPSNSFVPTLRAPYKDTSQFNSVSPDMDKATKPEKEVLENEEMCIEDLHFYFVQMHQKSKMLLTKMESKMMASRKSDGD